MKVLDLVGADMFLFYLSFGKAKIDTIGIPCLAKTDTGLKPANNSQQLDNSPVNLKFWRVEGSLVKHCPGISAKRKIF